MTDPQDEIRALRTALDVSPDNHVLRRMIAQKLVACGLYQDAEAEYKHIAAKHPGDATILLDLARCYRSAGKRSHALALLEQLAKGGAAAGESALVQAEVLLESGEVEEARRAFFRAIEIDPNLASSEAAVRLGFANAVSASGDASGADEEDDEEAGAPAPAPPARDEAARSGSRLERPKIGFADVGGMRDLKEEIAIKIIQPMLHPELYAAYGKKAGGGILLYGPPGCGKTLLARATAGECRSSFICVGIHDVLDMWLGKSERNLHELFALARRSAPCVLFFDEVDALGAKRSDTAVSAGRAVVNQFLSELDGVAHSNEGVLILAATNAPWQLDSAFRRPGRFDRILFVPPPDDEARASILGVLLAGKPCGEINAAAIAKQTAGYSGADLKAVVDHAVENKLRAALRTGKPERIQQKDLTDAVRLVGSSTQEWLSTARNYAMFANQGGRFDAIVKYLGL